jgi:hypothetical protein
MTDRHLRYHQFYAGTVMKCSGRFAISGSCPGDGMTVMAGPAHGMAVMITVICYQSRGAKPLSDDRCATKKLFHVSPRPVPDTPPRAR